MRYSCEVAVDGETKGPANGGDAANKVGAINSGCVPSVGGNVDGFDTDLGVTAAVVGGCGECFVEEAEESFDRDGLVVLTKAGFAGKFEGLAHGFEMAKKGGSGIRCDEEAEADTKENVFHKEGGEGDGVKGGELGDNGKTCEVAHGAKEVFGSVVGVDRARLPNVAVDNGEWGGHGPSVDEFAAAADGGVGGNAVGTASDPGFDVVAHAVPIKSKPNAVEGFEGHEMAGRRVRVEEFKNAAAEGGGGDDEKEGATGAAEGLGVGETATANADEFVAERVAVA